MEIPDPPFYVMRRIDGRLEHEVGPCETLEEAIEQVQRCPKGGDYVIVEHGRIVWPQGPGNQYS
jgi:hypothetical protein